MTEEREEDLKLQYVDPKTLNPAPYNPRKASEKDIEDVKASIAEFGYVDPLIVNCAAGRENVIIGGHLRHRIALEIGRDKVPVVFVHIPDEQNEKRLNLRLNRNQGSWDWKMLRDYDTRFLLDVGFSDTELKEQFDLLDKPPFEDEKPEGEEADEEEKPGDVVKYDLIFNDEAEQEVWFKFLRELKGIYPEIETTSERICKFIKEHTFGKDQEQQNPVP